MERDRQTIAKVMPAVSRSLQRGDWAGAFETLRRLGEELGERDPEEFAWQALRGLEARAHVWRDAIGEAP